jgi:hypothetical protein
VVVCRLSQSSYEIGKYCKYYVRRRTMYCRPSVGFRTDAAVPPPPSRNSLIGRNGKAGPSPCCASPGRRPGVDRHLRYRPGRRHWMEILLLRGTVQLCLHCSCPMPKPRRFPATPDSSRRKRACPHDQPSVERNRLWAWRPQGPGTVPLLQCHQARWTGMGARLAPGG